MASESEVPWDTFSRTSIRADLRSRYSTWSMIAVRAPIIGMPEPSRVASCRVSIAT
jgi:hypothetical protein